MIDVLTGKPYPLLDTADTLAIHGNINFPYHNRDEYFPYESLEFSSLV